MIYYRESHDKVWHMVWGVSSWGQPYTLCGLNLYAERESREDRPPLSERLCGNCLRRGGRKDAVQVGT